MYAMNKQHSSLFRAIWILRTISTVLVCLFLLNSIPCLSEAQSLLAPWPGTQRLAVKREAWRIWLELGEYIRCAITEEDKKTLEKEKAEALLLPTSEILVSKDVYDNPLELVKKVNHEKTEAVMRIIAWEEGEWRRYIYDGIKELILPEGKKKNEILEAYYNLFREKPSLPPNLLLNDIVATTFEFLIPLEQELIYKNELTSQEKQFVEAVKKEINSKTGKKYFTGIFWDWGIRENYIRVALANYPDMEFYQVAKQTGLGYARPAEKAFSPKREERIKKWHNPVIKVLKEKEKAIKKKAKQAGIKGAFLDKQGRINRLDAFLDRYIINSKLFTAIKKDKGNLNVMYHYYWRVFNDNEDNRFQIEKNMDLVRAILIDLDCVTEDVRDEYLKDSQKKLCPLLSQRIEWIMRIKKRYKELKWHEENKFDQQGRLNDLAIFRNLKTDFLRGGQTKALRLMTSSKANTYAIYKICYMQFIEGNFKKQNERMPLVQAIMIELSVVSPEVESAYLESFTGASDARMDQPAPTNPDRQPLSGETLNEMSRKLLMAVGAKEDHSVLVLCDSVNKMDLAKAVAEEAAGQGMRVAFADISKKSEPEAQKLINEKALKVDIGTRPLDECNIINLIGEGIEEFRIKKLSRQR